MKIDSLNQEPDRAIIEDRGAEMPESISNDGPRVENQPALGRVGRVTTNRHEACYG